MGISGRHIAIAAGALAFVVAGIAPARAQTCGDADGSGSVTVTDGVQVLRAAAGLSSTCSDHASSCDVDGSGSTTVSDGVNVLRKAAGLGITENCPGGGSTADVAQVTDVMVPFLTLGLKEVPNVASAGSAVVRPAATENCEDGGSRTTNQSGVTVTVTFDACRVHATGLGSFQFDGSLQAQLGFPTSSVSFELLVTDLSNAKVVDFDGTIQGQPRFPQSGIVVDGGPLVIRGPNEGPEIFRATFHELTVDGDGHLVSGSVEAEDTSDSFDLATAELEVESSTTATVHVVRDDQSTQDYQLNLQTGDLTPVS